MIDHFDWIRCPSVYTLLEVLDEIAQADDDTKKEFRRLLNKFLQDNYGEYRFYSNKMRIFERKNHQQYYGTLPEERKSLFIKEKKSKITLDDVINHQKSEPEEVKVNENQPKTLVEALEQEMKAAKLVEVRD